MGVPLLDFDALWRGSKCPRQLKAYLDHSPHFNPKLATRDDLAAAGLDWCDWSNPAAPAQAGAERLERSFQAYQELAVGRLLDNLFGHARQPEPGPLWQCEGETLRELGWLEAAGGAGRQPDLTKDNWPRLLPELPAVRDATAVHHFLVGRADYLFRAEDGWMLLLVKPGNRMRDSYVAEAEWLRWLFSQKGIAVKRLYALLPSDDFELDAGLGDIDPTAFFSLHSLNLAVKHLGNPLSQRIPAILTDAAAGAACKHPRGCPICGLDLPALPEHNIHTLHRGGKAVELLAAAGVDDLSALGAVPDAVKPELKDRHYIQLKAIRSGEAHVDKPALRGFLARIEWPVCFLDFESTSEALPPVAGVKPWEHVPFMFSSCRAASRQALGDGAALERRVRTMDPGRGRQEQLSGFAAALVDACAGCRTVLAYGSPLEVATFTRLARALPEQAPALLALRERIVDLQQPFAEFWYYHPGQHGKLSLKKVLPLVSERNHGGLELQSGGEANLLYYFLAHPDAAPDRRSGRPGAEERSRTLAALEEYCAMDTSGLAPILERLYELAE